ncbi:MAG: serine hydrolase [Bacteroidota bacterium]
MKIGLLGVLITQVLVTYSMYGQTKIDTFFIDLIETHGIPGISVAIIDDGSVIYNAAHGVKANDTNKPVDTQTIFSAASLSKQVFTYAVMKLVESGSIDLDRPLYQYLEFKDLMHDERHSKITARMVLSHSSGLPNWRNGKLELQFDPGEEYQYSGEGFVYLGKVVEHLQQKEINQVINELVFIPLGMSNSGFTWQDTFETNFAPPHDFMGFTLPKRKRRKSNVAASLQTTAEDYSKLILAVLNESELRESTINEMLSEQIGVPNWSTLHWGLGWGIQRTKKGKAIWQWGDNGTFKAFTINYLDTKKGIVFLTNSENGLRIVPDVVKYILEDECPAFKMVDYSLEDEPYQALLKRILQDEYEEGIAEFLHENQNHHDTALISQYQMKRIGFRLTRERRFNDAKKVYMSNINAYHSFDSYVQYANCTLKSGDFESAKTYYQKAKELKPDNHRINVLLSQLEPDSIQANVIFRLRQTHYTYSNLITIAGDFNKWNPLMHLFIKQNGEWVCRLKLNPGTYHYKLVIDGVWTLDPENPNAELDDNENINSVLVVE